MYANDANGTKVTPQLLTPDWVEPWLMAGDFSVGNWIVRPERLSMHLTEKTVQITPKAMAVLQLLADAKGRVVARNDIFDQVWPGATVTDDALTQCVVELRKAFDDSAQNPQYIETIPRKGLRLVQPVSEVVEDAAVAKRPRGRRLAQIAAALVAIGGIGAGILWATSTGTGPVLSDDVKTLAVLPFADTSETGDQTHIADGISEEIIARLGNLEDLLVVGRTSSFFYRDSEGRIETIARELDVRYLLEVGVRRSGNEIRTTAQLVDASSGYQLWNGTYDRPLEDIFAVQDEIAEAVARALSLKLDVGFLRDAGTRDVEAFEAFWMGVKTYYSGQTTPYIDKDGHRRSIEQFRRATRLDPEWAHAWAYLAMTYHWGRSLYGEPDPWTELALEALQRANDLAPNQQLVANVHATIHTSLGNWREAEMGVRRLELLRDEQPHLDARQAAALAVWPTEFAYWAVRFDLDAKTGRATDSIDAAEVLRARYPDEPLASLYLGHFHAMLGQSQQATALFKEIGWSKDGLTAALGSDDAELIQRWIEAAVGKNKAHVPQRDDINTVMAELLHDRESALVWLRDAYERGSAPDFWIAIWAGHHNATEIALDALRRSPDGWAMWLSVMEGIRQTPGFGDLVDEIGLVDYWAEFGWGDFCTPAASGEIACN